MLAEPKDWCELHMTISFSEPDYDQAIQYYRIDMYDGLVKVAEALFQYETVGKSPSIKVMYIGNIEVGIPYQRKGYGSRFVNHLEALAKRGGAKMVWIVPMRGAEDFWDMMGYRPGFGAKVRAEVRGPFGDAQKDYGMWKRV